MTALPRAVLSRLPRHTRLYRTCTPAQLERMPKVDLDVALALTFHRIDALNRFIPNPRNTHLPGWRAAWLARCAAAASLPPLPAASKSARRTMANDRARHSERVHGQMLEQEARAHGMAHADRQWDAYRREMERPGDGPLAAPKGPDFETWLHNPEE